MRNPFFYSKNKKLVASLFISLCAGNIGQANLPQFDSQNIQNQYDVVLEVGRQFQKGMISKEEALEVLANTLSDYSSSAGKIAILTQFIRNTTGILNPILQKAQDQRGWSNSEVYQIQREENGEVCLYLKIYPFGSKNFLPSELFGFSFLNQIKEIGSPKVYAIGQSIIDGRRYFLILNTPVPGMSTQQYFRQVGRCLKDSSARSLAFSQLCDATYACGVGIAKLHTYFPPKTEPLSEQFEEMVRQDLKATIEELTIQPQEGIEIEKLQAYVEHLLQEMKNSNHLLGVAFNDVKTIHTFYDSYTDKFSLVDPHLLYLSFNQDGETQGLIIKDVCKFIISLASNRFEYFLDENKNVSRKELLTNDEVNVLKNKFYLGYQDGGGVLPSSLEEEFILLQNNLFLIKNTSRNFPEPELTRINDLISESLESLRNQLKNSEIRNQNSD